MNYIDINLPNIVEAKDIHKNKLLTIIRDRKNVCPNANIVNFLTDEMIQNILSSTPDKLFILNKFFLGNIINDFSNEEFLNYFIYKLKKKKKPFEKEVIKKYELQNSILENIFNYDAFSNKNNKDYGTYDLSKKLDIPTCPYCNRMYTKTVYKSSKITRPAFDHWYPKSIFPILSLSFYNLIPSCNVCNSSVKGSDLFNLDTHFHPYSIIQKENRLLDFKYSYEHKDYSTFRFKIINNNDFSKNSTEAFKLKEIYETHEDEIVDLRRLRDVYSEKYLEMLKKNILKGTSTSDEEIYRLAFGTHIDETKFDRRPLSKMKKDILEELGILKYIK